MGGEKPSGQLDVTPLQSFESREGALEFGISTGALAVQTDSEVLALWLGTAEAGWSLDERRRES